MDESKSVAQERVASLRLAAAGALGFTLLYLLHRVGQGTGPADATPAVVAAYQVAHRAALLASEVAVMLALLVFVLVPAGLVPVLWKAGQANLAVAVAVTSSVFVAMGLVSAASETALANATEAQAAVLALNQLQGRIPVVCAFSGVAASIGWAILRSRLARRWVGVVSLAAAVVFLLGAVFSFLGPTPEGRSSIYGIGLAIAWTLSLGVGLWSGSRSPALAHGA